MTKRPKRMFRRRADHDVLIAPEGRGTNIILGDPDLEDLRGYNRPIRSRWWAAYHDEGIPNPIVVAAHRRSRLARERGLTDGAEFQFLALDMHQAVREGWLDAGLAVKPNRPPCMGILLATGHEVQAHVTSDMTETGVIDLCHFDADRRAEILDRSPPDARSTLVRYFDEPWTWRG